MAFTAMVALIDGTKWADIVLPTFGVVMMSILYCFKAVIKYLCLGIHSWS